MKDDDSVFDKKSSSGLGRMVCSAVGGWVWGMEWGNSCDKCDRGGRWPAVVAQWLTAAADCASGNDASHASHGRRERRSARRHSSTVCRCGGVGGAAEQFCVPRAAPPALLRWSAVTGGGGAAGRPAGRRSQLSVTPSRPRPKHRYTKWCRPPGDCLLCCTAGWCVGAGALGLVLVPSSSTTAARSVCQPTAAACVPCAGLSVSRPVVVATASGSLL